MYEALYSNGLVGSWLLHTVCVGSTERILLVCYSLVYLRILPVYS